jgi:hypothetical protein
MPDFITNRQHGTAVDAKAVTPSDSADLPDGPCRAVFVGSGGNLRITTGGGTTVTFNGLLAGQILPVMATRVWATSTTASSIIAVY